MELPISVLIHNELLGLKGAAGLLIQVYPEGIYLVTTNFGSKTHKVYLPINQTVLITSEAEEEALASEPIEIER